MGKNLTMRDCSARARLYRPKSLPFVVFEVKISGTHTAPCGTEAAACGKRAVPCGSWRFLAAPMRCKYRLKMAQAVHPLGIFVKIS
jgi:hypothetical protein